MNIDTAFPSNYLKAADIEEDTTLTITDVKVEKLGDDERPIVYFEEQDKGLVLNKTNANTIKGMYTSDTDNWLGKKITLFATEVDYAGKQTMAIRVRMRAPKSNGNGSSKAAAQPMDAITAFWKFVNETGYDREAAKTLINDNAGDFAAALKVLQAA